MTIVQYLSAFCTFSADVLVLAFGVTLVTSLFKKTVFKKCSRKLFVFLPFVLGLLFYAAYRAIVTLSFIPFTEELSNTLEGGFACGCAATLYYVVYEQFFRANKTEAPKKLLPVVTPLLAGFVDAKFAEEAAEKIRQGSQGLTGDKLFAFIRETLAGYTLPEVSQTELDALTHLVVDFLLKIPC
ncbi:MAG: hypothetical protein K2N74_02300 [Clostridiales bacterium]|nr:hypothetical protein [Clostridiales bacterium]